MVVATLRYARSYAVAHRTQAVVVVELQTPALSVQVRGKDPQAPGNWEPLTTPAGRRRTFPEGIRVRPASTAYAAAPVDKFTVTFSSLGRTDSTALVVRDTHGGERDLVVDGITGRCALAQEEQ
jgi:hypothetical protein